MNVREVIWRLDQKRLQKKEATQFGSQKRNVGTQFWPEYASLQFDLDALGLNFQNKKYTANTEIHQLKGPDFNIWPETFSYNLDYKQRDELGDARTNWEKNRHFDWALLAKAYYVTRDEKYLTRLSTTIDKWLQDNPFLHGISWTSAMEFAVRSVNWMVTLAFVRKAGKDIPQLMYGVINITDYLTKHYSRYSSANNHLLVEAAAIGLAGCCFNHDRWIDLACRILSEELDRQNYPDGINKELSLHYQTFGMEAYLLFMHALQKRQNRTEYLAWVSMLKKEAEFVAHSSWKEQIACEFGDDDEGKILDLQGGEWHQWEWVLQLASLIIGERYSSFEHVCENTGWLFTELEIEAIKNKPVFNSLSSKVFSQGGNSFFRDHSNRVLIGIDHAALGFGSIAAHGHADALSFQLFIDGVSVLVDPGTYIYHCDLKHRNSFRKTINHNTLCIDGRDQSQMLGAFLWGERAECRLESFSTSDKKDTLIASHDGYRPCIHTRSFEFDKISYELSICDTLTNPQKWVSTLMLGTNIQASILKDQVVVVYPSGRLIIDISGQDRITLEDTEVSPEYGVLQHSQAIRIYGFGQKTLLSIKIDMNN